MTTTASGVPSYKDKLAPRAQRKLLALDGGGIRGIISIEVLARIEDVLRKREGKPQLVLADYFDYIGGTSTGAIIATCLSIGMSVSEVRDFYLESGKTMFDRAALWLRYKYLYKGEELARKLQDILGAETTLGSDRLRTLLLLVLRNATTDSPWPLSNNPAAKYNDRTRDDCNLNVPLWKLVRASTAAPVYFPPEEVIFSATRKFVFVDGGTSVLNHPGFQLFQMAHLSHYKLGWPAGEDKMLLVSVGTGSAGAENFSLGPDGDHLLGNVKGTIAGLMNSACAQQDQLCRSFGNCVVGHPIDREVGDMIQTAPHSPPRLFRYARYDPDVTRAGLDALGLTSIQPEQIAPMDSVETISQMRDVGTAHAARYVKEAHFAGFAL